MYTLFAMYGTIGVIVLLAFIWYIFGGTLKRTVQTAERVADKGLNMLDDTAADQAFKVRLATSQSVLDSAAQLHALNITMTPHEMWEAYALSQAEMMSNAQGKALTPIERKLVMKAEFRGLMERHLASNQPQVQPQPQPQQANPQPQSQMMGRIRI